MNAFEISYALNEKEIRQLRKRSLIKNFLFFPFIFAMWLTFMFPHLISGVNFLKIKEIINSIYPSLLKLGDGVITSLLLFLMWFFFFYLLILFSYIFAKVKNSHNKTSRNQNQNNELFEYKLNVDKDGLTINQSKKKISFSWFMFEEIELKTRNNFFIIAASSKNSKLKTLFQIPFRVLSENNVTADQIVKVIKSFAPENSSLLNLSNNMDKTFILTVPK